MPSYQLSTSDDSAEYTGKYVELIFTQGASTETAHFFTTQETYLLSH